MRCESETDWARTGFQLAAQFAAGSFLLSGDTGGVMCACRASAQISEELSAYLSAYLNAVRQRTSSPDVGCSLAAMYIWGPALAFLLAFTGIGAVLLPLLTAAYGFFPAYAVSCMAASFGQAGRFDGRRFFRTAVSDYVSVFFPAGCSILGSGPLCAFEHPLGEDTRCRRTAADVGCGLLVCV